MLPVQRRATMRDGHGRTLSCTSEALLQKRGGCAVVAVHEETDELSETARHGFLSTSHQSTTLLRHVTVVAASDTTDLLRFSQAVVARSIAGSSQGDFGCSGARCLEAEQVLCRYRRTCLISIPLWLRTSVGTEMQWCTIDNGRSEGSRHVAC